MFAKPRKLLGTVRDGAVQSCIHVGIVRLVFSGVEDHEVNRSNIPCIIELSFRRRNVLMEFSSEGSAEFMIAARENERFGVFEALCRRTEPRAIKVLFGSYPVKRMSKMGQKIR